MSENQTADDTTGEETAPASQTDDDILDEARKRFKMCQDADGDNRTLAKDDLTFLVGGENQWEPTAVARRKADGRPIITVNTLPTYLHQVTNDQRQNTPSIKVHPVGDGADIETARVRQGMIRHIEYDSNADTAYDTAVNSAAAIGFGYFRAVTEFESETSPNQKIMIQRIRNALSVKIDPLSIEADGSDMKYAFIECPYPREEFKREWPNANACNSSLFNDSNTQYVGWLSDSVVLVCEYYRVEEEKAMAVALSNGESGWKDKLLSLPAGVVVKKEYERTRRKVMLYKITGCDVLEKTEIKCKWIPVFPVYGDEIDIEGKIIRSGIVRNAKGPAQAYNVFMTGATEEIALRTKAPYIGAEGQFAGHEDEWAQANNRAFPYLEYTPVSLDGRLSPPPQRQPMADIPTGMLAMAMHARDNIKATTGLFDSSLGAKGTATSGIQEREQQQQGDMANFHYQDGLTRTLRHVGRCIDCMIPSYYDWQGVARIMREDNTMEFAPINEPQTVMQDGQAITTVLNDMTCGEYAITVETGPQYSTMREESADAMADAMNKNPQLWGVFGDLYVKSRDWPNAQEIAERVAKTIPPDIRGPQEGEEAPPPMVPTPQGPVPVPQAAQIIEAMQMQLEQAQQALQKANADKQALDMMKQQQLLADQQLEPQRQAVEMKRLDADIAKANAAASQAQAATISAQADLERAQGEAMTAPERAAAELETAQTSRMTAEINLARAHQQIQLDAADAEQGAIDGNGEAFEAWKAALESRTKIIVAEIMARASERRAERAATTARAGAE